MSQSVKKDDPLECPACGLTLAELRTQGRMGCAACYAVFTDVVTQATAELHGVQIDRSSPSPPSLPPLPWPTRRAETRRSEQLPLPSPPPARPRRRFRR